MRSRASVRTSYGWYEGWSRAPIGVRERLKKPQPVAASLYGALAQRSPHITRPKRPATRKFFECSRSDDVLLWDISQTGCLSEDNAQSTVLKVGHRIRMQE